LALVGSISTDVADGNSVAQVFDRVYTQAWSWWPIPWSKMCI